MHHLHRQMPFFLCHHLQTQQRPTSRSHTRPMRGLTQVDTSPPHRLWLSALSLAALGCLALVLLGSPRPCFGGCAWHCISTSAASHACHQLRCSCAWPLRLIAYSHMHSLEATALLHQSTRAAPDLGGPCCHSAWSFGCVYVAAGLMGLAVCSGLPPCPRASSLS